MRKIKKNYKKKAEIDPIADKNVAHHMTLFGKHMLRAFDR